MNGEANDTTIAPPPLATEYDFDLRDLLSASDRCSGRRFPSAEPKDDDAICIGELVGFDDAGQPLVKFDGESSPVPALTIADVGLDQLGHRVAVTFVGGNARHAIIMGVIREPRPQRTGHEADLPMVEVERDKERIELSANQEIVLRCGKASITLTRSGKILLRGAYLSSRSSGVNRIKGGSVHIN